MSLLPGFDRVRLNYPCRCFRLSSKGGDYHQLVWPVWNRPLHFTLGVLAPSQWCSGPASVLQTKSKQTNPEPHRCILTLLFPFPCFWKSASGYISDCQRLRVQRHGAYGTPAWEGGKDSCSGSWHDQVGTEVPGGECDETVCFGCSCNCGCAEVNKAFHSTGIIFFFQLNVIFPTRECFHATLPLYLALWSERLLRLLHASGAWLLFLGSVQLPTIRDFFFFQGKIPPHVGAIFQTRIDRKSVV